MIKPIVTALVLGLALTGAAQASTASCYASRPGVHVSFGISVGGKMSQDEKNQFNLMQLRQMGVDATRAEMWGGCIRAFVKKPGGGEEMQFFHPDSFERVDP